MQRRNPGMLASLGIAIAALSGLGSAPAGLMRQEIKAPSHVDYEKILASIPLDVGGSAPQRRARKHRMMSARCNERANRRAASRKAKMRRRRAA